MILKKLLQFTHIGLATVVVALVLVACGVPASGDPTESGRKQRASTRASAAVQPQADRTEPEVKACSVLTQAEVETILGTAVSREEDNGTRCTYYSDNPLVYVDLHVFRNGQTAWQGVKGGQQVVGAALDPIKGVGDEAFFGPRDILYVRSGDTVLQIEAGFDDQVRDRALLTAPLVLSHIP